VNVGLLKGALLQDLSGLLEESGKRGCHMNRCGVPAVGWWYCHVYRESMRRSNLLRLKALLFSLILHLFQVKRTTATGGRALCRVADAEWWLVRRHSRVVRA